MEKSTNIIGIVTMLRFFTKKLLMNRRWVIVMLIAMFLASVMGYAASQTEDRLYDGSELIGTLMLSFLLPIMALIYGASMIRNEIEDRSITTVIASPLDRRISYLGYYLSLIIVLTLMLLLVLFVGWAVFFIIAGFDVNAVGLLFSYAVLLCIGALVYSALFLAFGVLMRQPIYLGLIFAFVWEGFIGSVPGGIGSYTIMRQIKVIGSDMVSYGTITETSGDVITAVFVLVVAVLSLLLIGAFVFRDKEIP